MNLQMNNLRSNYNTGISINSEYKITWQKHGAVIELQENKCNETELTNKVMIHLKEFLF